jgi:glycosyltransferase involved in cell wall biosynthesis
MTNSKTLCILQVNTQDVVGGAAKIALNLFQGYQKRGHDSWLAVGYKSSTEPNVVSFFHPPADNPWTRLCYAFGNKIAPFVGKIRGVGKLQVFFYRVGSPLNAVHWWKGLETMNYPATWRLLDLIPNSANILHLHNLHGQYFDLRALPEISSKLPVVTTLHDAWLLGGHCAFPFDCSQWKNRCSVCPDITKAPPIQKDASYDNFNRKAAIYRSSKLYAATPSEWLMGYVKDSILAQGVKDAKVIHNGVDLSVFKPNQDKAIRGKLGLPQYGKILIFSASGILKNPHKDYLTIQSAFFRIAERMKPQPLLLIALGEKSAPIKTSNAEIRFIPYIKHEADIARYYQASDLLIHAAKFDNFPTTILEALACGIPVVATEVCGIKEQVKSLTQYHHDATQATGVLVPKGDAQAMADACVRTLQDETLIKQLGMNAHEDAKKRFSLDKQIDAYLQWYETILETTDTERLNRHVTNQSARKMSGEIR